MYLKPYFYYRQQYQRLNKSDEADTNSAENDSNDVTSEVNNVNENLEQAKEAEKDAGGLVSGPGQEDHLKSKATFEHSRFQKVAPGVFQFKHTRPKMIQHPFAPMVDGYAPEFLAGPSQTDKKPGREEFVRIGTFPGPSDYGLPVYQFT